MNRRAMLVMALAVAATSMACSKTSGASELKTLTVDDVAAKLAAHTPNTFIYDNNDQERWAKSHVPGAKWLKHTAVTAADLPADKGATLIFYCSSEL
jgi:hypothetical protein